MLARDCCWIPHSRPESRVGPHLDTAFDLGLEPVRDTIYGECGGVAGVSDKDGAAIGLQVVDSVGHRPALGLRPEVMIVDPCWGLTPEGPGIGKLPDQFFLLGIHTDHSNALGTTVFNQSRDLMELLIPSCRRGTTEALPIHPRRIVTRAEPLPHGRWTGLDSILLQGCG